jgi:hypothetical protein
MLKPESARETHSAIGTLSLFPGDLRCKIGDPHRPRLTQTRHFFSIRKKPHVEHDPRIRMDR